MSKPDTATATAFLPFTRPAIDEATIAARRRGAALGLDHLGPEGARVRGRAVAAVRRPAGARLQLRHGDDGNRAARRRHRPGRRGHHHADLAGSRPPTSIVAVGATPVFVDIDPRTRNIDLDRARGGDHAAHARAHAGRSGRPAGRHGPALRDRRARTACASSRTRRRRSAARWGGRRIGAFGDLVSASASTPTRTSPRAEGGCLVLNDEAEARRRRAAAAAGRRRTGADGMDVDAPGGKFNLTDIAARIGLRPAAARSTGFTAAPRRAGATLLRSGCAARRWKRSASSCRCRRLRRARATGTCSRSCCLPSRLAGGRADVMERDAAPRASAPACTIRRCTCSRCTARSAGATAMFPVAERIGRSILTLPLFPAMTDGRRRARRATLARHACSPKAPAR